MAALAQKMPNTPRGAAAAPTARGRLIWARRLDVNRMPSVAPCDAGGVSDVTQAIVRGWGMPSPSPRPIMTATAPQVPTNGRAMSAAAAAPIEAMISVFLPEASDQASQPEPARDRDGGPQREKESDDGCADALFGCPDRNECVHQVDGHENGSADRQRAPHPWRLEQMRNSRGALVAGGSCGFECPVCGSDHEVGGRCEEDERDARDQAYGGVRAGLPAEDRQG